MSRIGSLLIKKIIILLVSQCYFFSDFIKADSTAIFDSYTQNNASTLIVAEKNYSSSSNGHHLNSDPLKADLKPNFQHESSANYPTYPPTNHARGELKELIKKGEYLSKMGDCISCHTNVVGNTPAYAGGLSINTPFGVFYTPNITPDPETGIGKWTEKDFIRALKEGRAPNGSNYFPVFPYLYFAKITDDDAKALYAYFMNIPAVKQKNKDLSFPFNVPGARLSLWGWKMLFFFPQNQIIRNNPDESDLWNRGKYIVDGLGHCSMCHTPLNAFGGPRNVYYLTGALLDGYWAPNISKNILGPIDNDEIISVFKHNQLINKAGTVAGPMQEVNYNSLRYLKDEDLLAIATYIKTVVSKERLGVPPSDLKPTLARGKKVYLSSCITCHQDGQMSAPVIGNPASWFLRLKESKLDGLYKHTILGFNSMPIKGACATCSDNDIKAAVDYILAHSLTKSQWRDFNLSKEPRLPIVRPNGKNVYDKNCSSCHNEGLNGAPKIGDKKIWEPLIAKNIDVLVQNVANGKNHPQNGSCKDCTTSEIIEAIKYIVSKSKTTGNYSLW